MCYTIIVHHHIESKLLNGNGEILFEIEKRVAVHADSSWAWHVSGLNFAVKRIQNDDDVRQDTFQPIRIYACNVLNVFWTPFGFHENYTPNTHLIFINFCGSLTLSSSAMSQNNFMVAVTLACEFQIIYFAWVNNDKGATKIHFLSLPMLFFSLVREFSTMPFKWFTTWNFIHQRTQKVFFKIACFFRSYEDK